LTSQSKVASTVFLAFSLVSLGPGTAMAGCIPSLNGDGFNTCIGERALQANTSGDFNTAIGSSALFSNKSGNYNTANGQVSLNSNTRGNANTASGAGALYSNTLGNYNTAAGAGAMSSNTTGEQNVAIGGKAGSAWTTGKNNIALGYGAGMKQVAGSNNISIGGPGEAADNGVIRIGDKQKQVRTFVAGIQTNVISNGIPVVVNSAGQLGISQSVGSLRYKQNIQSMGDVAGILMQLRPVTYRYMEAQEDGSRPLQYGLIAEEVEKVIPELVIHDEEGVPEGVAYQVLPSLLLNEYQKQNRKLVATETKLEAPETRLEALESELAAMKLMLSRLASAQPGQVAVALSP
jgi:hypothetical protein